VLNIKKLRKCGIYLALPNFYVKIIQKLNLNVKTKGPFRPPGGGKWFF
jgi:hypothetical protein